MKDVNENNLIEAFEMLIGIYGGSNLKSPNSLCAPSIESYGDVFAKLNQILKTKIVDMDLFQAIKDNHVILYEIKGLF